MSTHSGLWANDESGWQLLSPAGFPDEATLHTLVEEAPQLLPLSGGPQIVVVGREVQIGPGRADLVAVETSGRPVLIEVKLRQSSEARKAIASQMLAYAAFLHKTDPEVFEREVLGSHLRSRNFEGLAEAVAANYQQGSFEKTAFDDQLADSLAAGRFRLVFVLDEAPVELIRLIGYLETVAQELLIDLITVASYDVNGSTVLVPQRIEPERHIAEVAPRRREKVERGTLTEGGDVFLAAIDDAQSEHKDTLRRLYNWAISLEREGFVRLVTYQGTSNRLTLLPRLKGVDAGLATIWNDKGTAYISVWRSVFEKRAPHSIRAIEELIAPATIGQGNTVSEIPDELLNALTVAYREAASPADVVVVAAGTAYDEYLKYSTYACQSGRSFREGLGRMGFYTGHEVKPEFPRILHRRDHVPFTTEEIARLRASGEPIDRSLAETIDRLLADGPRLPGNVYQVFLLTDPSDPETLVLPQAINYPGSGAWVQKQRYTRSEFLRRNPASTTELE